MSKKRPFDPMGKGYDVATWKKTGFPAVYNPEDKKMHTGSLDPKTGMVLKGRTHPTWNLHEITEAAMGAKPVYKTTLTPSEKAKGFKANRYYTEGSGPLNVKQKPGTNIKTDKKIRKDLLDRG